MEAWGGTLVSIVNEWSSVMPRKDSQSKSILVLKTKPRRFEKDVDKELRELCSKHKIKNSEPFIKALYKQVGIREWFLSTTIPTKDKQKKFLETFKNQCSRLSGTIHKKYIPEFPLISKFKMSRAVVLGINENSLVQLEKVLEKLSAEIEEARDRVDRMPSVSIKRFALCSIADYIKHIFDQFNVPVKHSEGSAYYECIRLFLSSVDAPISSVRSFMSNCRKIKKQSYKP